MGQFSDRLDKLMQVEAEGFDPYRETYSARIGKLEAAQQAPIVDATGANAVTPDDPTQATDPTPSISERFTALDYEDPFKGFVTPEGKIDQGKLSYNFNLLKDDPEIGVSQDEYLQFVNDEYEQQKIKTNIHDLPYIKTESGNIGFPATKDPEPPKYRYEKAKGAKNKDIYLRFEEGTEDERGGEKYITFDTEDAYKNDLAQYKAKQSTGLNSKK